LRYVLETCSTAREATQTLARLPSHMAYNVTVVDASGATATVSVSPHHAAVTNDVGYATNHQDAFPGTIMPDSVLRQLAILDELEGRAASVDELMAAFLKPPLYSAAFSEGRGTLYTAAYHVDHRVLELVWPGRNWHLPLNGFEHQRLEVGYGAAEDQIENIYVPAGIRAVNSRD